MAIGSGVLLPRIAENPTFPILSALAYTTGLEICLKPSTIVLLLILSKKSVLQLTVVYHPTFVVAFNSVYHTAVVLRTHLLIRKTILLISLLR